MNELVEDYPINYQNILNFTIHANSNNVVLKVFKKILPSTYNIFHKNNTILNYVFINKTEFSVDNI